VHLLQALGHLPEALAQALLERGVQLLVHGGAHLLELLSSPCCSVTEARLHRACAPRRSCALAGLGQPRRRSARSSPKARSAASCPARASCACCASPCVACASALAHQRLRGGQLRAEGVDLLVLRARHVAALREQHLLEGAPGRRAWPAPGL
jgi:hypothetical protein